MRQVQEKPVTYGFDVDLILHKKDETSNKKDIHCQLSTAAKKTMYYSQEHNATSSKGHRY